MSQVRESQKESQEVSQEVSQEELLESKVSLEVRRHGRGAAWTYSDLDRRQREVAHRARAGGKGALLLSEVGPVITLGRRALESELMLPRTVLEKLGIEILRTDRGGLATYHGPGQWVLFAVDRLESLVGDPRGVREAVEALLGIALKVAREYEPKAECRSGLETGIWSPRGKLGAVGVHIEQGVLLHGLSLNVFKTPTSFQGLRPCGLDLPVDYLVPEASEIEFMNVCQRLVQESWEAFWKPAD